MVGPRLNCHRFELRSHVRKLGRKPTTAQKLELTNKRRKLRARITAFSNTAAGFLGETVLESIYEVDQIVIDDEVSSEEEEDLSSTTFTVADPEGQVLPFPSAVSEGFLSAAPAEQKALLLLLRKTELDLRGGQADDSLDHVRKAVIHLSWEFKNTLRTALSGQEKSRAWDKAKVLSRLWKLHRKVYNHTRNVMMSIGTRGDVETKYPFLEIKDCQASTTVSDVNERGGSSYRLPWYWSSSARVAATAALDGEHENECNVNLTPDVNDMLMGPSVYRVNWLRARAQNNRWTEELNLTFHEMEWTVRWYVHKAEQWQFRRNAEEGAGTVSRGRRAYAEKQMAMWNELGRVSDAMFSTNTNHTSVWNPVL
jgi:hypothetical protein